MPTWVKSRPARSTLAFSAGATANPYPRASPRRTLSTATPSSGGLRMAVWALDTQQREGPQQSFLDEVRAFHVVPVFRTPADLERQVRERLHRITAEDLAPWTKLGLIVFRANKVIHAGGEIAVTARVQSDDVAHALEALAPDGFGGGEELRFTWAGRCRYVRVANVQSTTTTARSKLMHLQMEVVDGHRDPLIEVTFNNLTPGDLTDVAIRTALFGEPNPFARQHMDFMAEMPDPLQPLRDADVPDEIVRPLAEVMIVDGLVGSSRADRVTEVQTRGFRGRPAKARTRMGTAAAV